MKDNNKNRHLLSGYYMPNPFLNFLHVCTCLILITILQGHAITFSLLTVEES